MANLFRHTRNHVAERSAQSDALATTSDSTAPQPPFVYRGTLQSPPDAALSGVVTPPRNRKVTKRKVSTFSIILILFSVAAVSVLYISNIIAVNTLMMEISILQKRHSRIVSEQEILKAEINRLSSLERINRKAAEELGLVNPTEPPRWISVDQEKIREVEQALQHIRK
jgi:cell division protein FtsL